MTERNQYGLTRNIPSEVARQVRQRDGFGCVICGSAFIQYDHLDPPFAEAQSHEPSGLVLLCGGCHDRRSRGALSVDSVKRAAVSPKCKQSGFSRGAFDLGQPEAPIVWFGNVLLWECETLLVLNGEPVLAIKPPEESGGPFRLTAQFRDSDGKEILSIVDNEWLASSENWDVQVTGPRISVRRAKGDLALVLRATPPKQLFIERISMLHRGIRVECHEGKPTFILPNGAGHSISGAQVTGAEVGLELTSSGILIGKRARKSFPIQV